MSMILILIHSCSSGLAIREAMWGMLGHLPRNMLCQPKHGRGLTPYLRKLSQRLYSCAQAMRPLWEKPTSLRDQCQLQDSLSCSAVGIVVLFFLAVTVTAPL